MFAVVGSGPSSQADIAPVNNSMPVSIWTQGKSWVSELEKRPFVTVPEPWAEPCLLLSVSSMEYARETAGWQVMPLDAVFPF